MVKETKKTKSKTPAKQGKKQAKAKAVEKAEQQQSAPVEVAEVEQAKTKEQKLDEAKTKTPDSVPIKKQTRKVKASNKSKRFRKIEKITSDHRMNRGVVYLGHIPYGFFENEIKEFFSQFGTVTRVKLARSKKTARSKGYAFVEFDNLETASIAADTGQ